MTKRKKQPGYASPGGARAYKWAGYCSSCGEWNTIVEEVIKSDEPARGIGAAAGSFSKPVAVGKVSFTETPRFSSGSVELDRVLGGGIVPGSFVLVGGDPGIGKSTLLTQLASRVADSRGSVLYISAEESPQQVRLRAERLGAVKDNFWWFLKRTWSRLRLIVKKSSRKC